MAVPIAEAGRADSRPWMRRTGGLKLNSSLVPYFPGLAIYRAFLCLFAFTFEFRSYVLGIILGATIVVMLGLIDHFRVLTPLTKLAGQLLAVFVLIKERHQN